MTALTAKQHRFVAEYLVDGNGARAAVAAGYGRAGAKVTAHRLTHANQAVESEIRARQAQDSHRLQIQRQDVLQGLLEAVQQARAQSNPGAMIHAWKVLAQLLGFMTPAAVLIPEGRAGDTSGFERLTDAELVSLIAGRADSDATV